VIDSLIANAFSEILMVSHHGDFRHNVMIREVLEAKHAEGKTGVRWLYAVTRWKMIERLGMTGDEPIWVRWGFVPELERFRVTGIVGFMPTSTRRLRSCATFRRRWTSMP